MRTDFAQLRRLPDLLFPRRCPFCGSLLGPDALQGTVCPACVPEEMRLQHIPARLPEGEHDFYAVREAAAAYYYEDIVRTAVLRCKRGGCFWYARELADHCMEDIDKTFVTRVKAGDIMVGGENFGCGSSREHAPVAIKAAGIDCVIAKSFARIFYRNAINIGLPILECPAASEAINEGDVVAINFDTGVITDETTGQTFQAAPFPPFIQKIIKAGGLMKSIQEGK